MIHIIEYNGEQYPTFQTNGNAARFALPFAKEVCTGMGFDVGYNKKEWQLPGSIGIDISYYKGEWHALNLPKYYFELNGIKYPVHRNIDVFKVIEMFKINNDEVNIIPIDTIDYIFSSHCLEHINNWVTILDYWIDTLDVGGTLLLYLPHYSQRYWRPWNNKSHVHVLTKEILTDYFNDRKTVSKLFISDCDLNNSFMVMAEKK